MGQRTGIELEEDWRLRVDVFKMEEIMVYLCAVWNDPIEAKLMMQGRGGDITGKISLNKKEDKELPLMPCCYAGKKKNSLVPHRVPDWGLNIKLTKTYKQEKSMLIYLP